jgi:hypothetical protein
MNTEAVAMRRRSIMALSLQQISSCFLHDLDLRLDHHVSELAPPLPVPPTLNPREESIKLELKQKCIQYSQQ